MSERRSGINFEIEYLRAVAVLLVVFGHIDALFPDFPRLKIGAWTGVDLFFCISGYVISRSYESVFDRYIEEGRWGTAARAFWIRRIFRLAPSAWLWLGIGIFLSWGFNSSGAFGTVEGTVKTAIYFLTFVMNLAMAHGDVHANAYFWSLTLEDQFYFVFPFFLLLFRGHWRWNIFLLLIFLQALPDRSQHDSPYPSYFWATRTDALMWGCLIYQFSRSIAYRKLEPTFLQYRIAVLLVNAVLLYLLVTIPRGAFESLIGYKVETAVALVSAAWVFLASFDKAYVLPLPFPFRAVLAWVGSRSYGIYLIHIPVLGLTHEISLRYAQFLGEKAYDFRYVQALMIFVLLLILAELNFRFVESPLRRKGANLAKRIMAEPVTAATALSPQVGELDLPAHAGDGDGPAIGRGSELSVVRQKGQG